MLNNYPVTEDKHKTIVRKKRALERKPHIPEKAHIQHEDLTSHIYTMKPEFLVRGQDRSTGCTAS